MIGVHESYQHLPSYTTADGKKAWENGETEFIVTSKYPIPRGDPLPPSDCPGCTGGGVEVHFEKREAAIVLRCARCTRYLAGGYAHLGFRPYFKRNEPARTFNGHDRDFILRRDRVKCFFCGATPETDQLDIDHIVPFSLGGPTELVNGVTLCQRCNSEKSNRGNPVLMLHALAYTHQDLIKDEGVDGLVSLVRIIAVALKKWGAVK